MITPTERYSDIEKLLAANVTNIKENRNFSFTFEGITYRATVFNYTLQVPCINTSNTSVNTDVLLVIMNALNVDILSLDSDGTHTYYHRAVEESTTKEEPTCTKATMKKIALLGLGTGISIAIGYGLNKLYR